MEETKLSRILNQVIITLILSAIIFIYAQHYLKNLYLSISLTGAIILIITTEINFFRKKKTNRLNLKKEELEYKNQIISHFIYSSEELNLSFFKNAFEKINIKTEIKDKFLVAKNILLFPCFYSNCLSEEQLISAIKFASGKNLENIIIFCVNQGNINLTSLNSAIKVSILNDYETFAFLKQINIFPIQEIKTTQKHTHLIFSKNNKLSFNHYKSFLMASIFLFIGSFLVPHKLYYITLSAIMLLMSLICLLLFKKEKKQQEHEIVLKAIQNETKT
ncbi:MAG: hypothetical protein IJT25_03505 [Clostridia bacterium]|nr:hypothetical protein [Clostridia bacterium]